MTRRFSPRLKSRVANVCRKTCGPIPLVLIRDFLKYFFTDCSCDACAPISWTACVQREGLALSVWPSTQGSFLTALGLRFAALWLAVVMVSFGITVYILPYGVGLFAGAAVLTIAGILPIVPRWFG